MIPNTVSDRHILEDELNNGRWDCSQFERELIKTLLDKGYSYTGSVYTVEGETFSNPMKPAAIYGELKLTIHNNRNTFTFLFSELRK